MKKLLRIGMLLCLQLIIACVGSSLTTQAQSHPSLRLTPVVASVERAPIPVKGSDGLYHVVYEILLINATPVNVTIAGLDILDAKSGAQVASLGAADLALRLVVKDHKASPGVLGAAQTGLLYLHLTFDNTSAIPTVVAHRFSGQAGNDTYQETIARTVFLAPTQLLLSPPLKGSRYIAGDGCCDSTRHVRATLAVNGIFFDAQRFAIDWEQLNEQGRIYVGDPKVPDSYIIYGKPVYAVADGRVVAAVDGRKDSPPGSFPEGSLEDADGNHVVLELGDGSFALYAHLKPNSVKVSEGNRVRAGQVLGLVGTSGRSSEPHLHFQITDGAPLASSGLPYLLTYFAASTRVTSTAAFDRAILDGQPIETEPIPGPATHSVEMPLDLWIIDFPR